MALVEKTWTYDFENGSAGSEVTAGQISSGDVTATVTYLKFANSPALGSLSGVANDEFSAGAIEGRPGAPYASLAEAWEPWKVFYPVYSDFYDAIIGAYGSEEAGLAAMNASGGKPLTATGMGARYYIIEPGEMGGFTAPVDLSTASGDRHWGVRVTSHGISPDKHGRLYFWHSVSPDPVVLLDTGVNIPAGEWTTHEIRRTGATTMVGSVKSASGAVLASHTWTVPADAAAAVGHWDVHAITDTVNPDSFGYLDDIWMTYEVEAEGMQGTPDKIRRIFGPPPRG